MYMYTYVRLYECTSMGVCAWYIFVHMYKNMCDCACIHKNVMYSMHLYTHSSLYLRIHLPYSTLHYLYTNPLPLLFHIHLYIRIYIYSWAILLVNLPYLTTIIYPYYLSNGAGCYTYTTTYLF